MCGIVGYVGPRKARPLLLAGLEKLEYRGYDSAGISVLHGDRIDAVRAVGNLSALRDAIASCGGHHDHAGGAVALAERPVPGTGIGHTRWATHGRVTQENAHPHFDNTDRVHIVVNGIVENYISLKRRLVAEGAEFTSETDAEVIAHLVAHYHDGDLVDAVRRAYADLRGHYAFVAMTADEPGVLVGARKECPLIIGRGDGEQFIASAIPAFLRHTRRVQYIENDEIVVLRPDDVEFSTADGTAARPGDHRDRLGRGHRREAGLRDVHAQGDPRAGRRGRRDDRRARRARGRDRPRRPRPDRRRDAAHREADRGRRLRHLVPRRA